MKKIVLSMALIATTSLMATAAGTNELEGNGQELYEYIIDNGGAYSESWNNGTTYHKLALGKKSLNVGTNTEGAVTSVVLRGSTGQISVSKQATVSYFGYTGDRGEVSIGKHADGSTSLGAMKGDKYITINKSANGDKSFMMNNGYGVGDSRISGSSVAGVRNVTLERQGKSVSLKDGGDYSVNYLDADGNLQRYSGNLADKSIIDNKDKVIAYFNLVDPTKPVDVIVEPIEEMPTPIKDPSINPGDGNLIGNPQDEYRADPIHEDGEWNVTPLDPYLGVSPIREDGRFGVSPIDVIVDPIDPGFDVDPKDPGFIGEPVLVIDPIDPGFGIDPKDPVLIVDPIDPGFDVDPIDPGYGVDPIMTPINPIDPGFGTSPVREDGRWKVSPIEQDLGISPIREDGRFGVNPIDVIVSPIDPGFGISPVDPGFKGEPVLVIKPIDPGFGVKPIDDGFKGEPVLVIDPIDPGFGVDPINEDGEWAVNPIEQELDPIDPKERGDRVSDEKKAEIKAAYLEAQAAAIEAQQVKDVKAAAINVNASWLQFDSGIFHTDVYTGIKVVGVTAVQDGADISNGYAQATAGIEQSVELGTESLELIVGLEAQLGYQTSGVSPSIGLRGNITENLSVDARVEYLNVAIDDYTERVATPTLGINYRF